MVLEEDVFLLIKSYFRMVGCGLCANSGVNPTACKYCSNKGDNNIMGHISDKYAKQLTKELMKTYEKR